MRLTDTQLQTELAIIAHHLDDVDVGLKEKDYDYVKRGLKDIREVVARLCEFLPKEKAKEIERIKENFENRLSAVLEEVENGIKKD